MAPQVERSVVYGLAGLVLCESLHASVMVSFWITVISAVAGSAG